MDRPTSLFGISAAVPDNDPISPLREAWPRVMFSLEKRNGMSLKDVLTGRISSFLQTHLTVFNRRARSTSTSDWLLTEEETPVSPPVHQLSQEATSPRTACALLSTLVLHFDGAVRTRQLERIAWFGDERLMAEILRLEPQIVVLSPEERLALVPAAIRGLSQLPSHQRHRFMANVRSLVNADEAVSLFEYTVLLLVETALETTSSDPRLSPANPEEVSDQITTLVAVLARAASRDEAAARRAYELAMRSLSREHRSFPPYRASFERLSWAMRGLRRVTPPLADRILTACQVVVSHTTGPNTSLSPEYRALLRGLRGCLGQDAALTSAGQRTQPENLSPAV